MNLNNVVCGDALQELQKLDNDSVDLVVTDPPYGYSFMNKDWDKAVVGVDTWKECLRVLKAGAFAFIMSSPRQDVLAKMVVNLIDAGFETNFTSIYWTYASGFPKAADVSKLVDKRNGRPDRLRDFEVYLDTCIKNKYDSHYSLAEQMGIHESMIRHWIGKCGDEFVIPSRERYNELKQKLGLDNRFDSVIEEWREWEEAERNKIQSTGNLHKNDLTHGWSQMKPKDEYLMSDKQAITAKAIEVNGAYAGFQPKPAVEVVLTVMKPLSEKTYVDQALTNGHGITWLDDCRIPYQDDNDLEETKRFLNGGNNGLLNYRKISERHGYDNLKKIPVAAPPPNQKGRFPANLLVSDDVLNDGKITKSDGGTRFKKFGYRHYCEDAGYDHITEQGKDKAFVTNQPKDSGSFSRYFDLDRWYETTFPFLICAKASKSEKNKGLDKWIPQTVTDGRQTPIDNPFQRGETPRQNTHATVKPIKLMSYLIMLGSRPNDIILDPFCGSGTTCIAAKILKRSYLGIELNQEYVNIANARLVALEDEQPTLFEMVTT